MKYNGLIGGAINNKISIYNCDNMELLRQTPDNYYSLAIVDPPYGINADVKRGDTGKNKHIKQKDYHRGDWDSEIPKPKYFEELRRVSKNQIIWGGNYFLDFLPATPCFVVWDKDNSDNLYADCEIAWTSFNTAVRRFKWRWHGFLQQNMAKKEERIHPTQKPIALYEWLLMKYAKEGDKILDTHLGSGSIAIAAHNLGFDLTACELDTEYYEAALKRLKQHQSQLRMF